MNEGKLLKQLYSPESHVEKLIEEAVKAWPYGFCEFIKYEQLRQEEDSWPIEICSQHDEESTKTLIDAYMHICCGFSYICCDGGEIQSWIGDSDIFRTITISNKDRDFVSELGKALSRENDIYKDRGWGIKNILLTIRGKMISLDELELYGTTVQTLDIPTVLNMCLFNDDSLHTDIICYLALQPTTKKSQ